MNQIKWKIFFLTTLLTLSLLVLVLLFTYHLYVYLIIAVPLFLRIFYLFYRSQTKIYDDVNQFVEAVHYHDFSRYFDIKHAPSELKPIRTGFNNLNLAFRNVSKEKETQYLYLQGILEMIETGILSFEEQSGNVLWLNDSLKKMLGLPYLKHMDSLRKRNEAIYSEVISVKPGENKVIPIYFEKTSVRVLLSATVFHTEGKKYKLLAFQNINEALDETESRAWQKLLSVLTHEIMNSVAPISSLADTLKNRLESPANSPGEDPCTAEDIKLGIETIKRRSEGLLKFAEIYRSLNKITTLNLKKIYVRDLFENLYMLMQPTLEKKNIQMDIILKDPGLQFDADANLVEQVLINLVLNAVEAVKDQAEPLILLSARLSSERRAIIEVADNGYGIAPEIMDQIFVPFFSTRKNGSGIGLSLCKQIMLLHKGSINARSEEGKGTVFILQF